VPTSAVLSAAPVCAGRLQLTAPVLVTEPIALPAAHVPARRAWSWSRFARTFPTARGWIFLYVTAPLRILSSVTPLSASRTFPIELGATFL
jgi:hypothetical protein